MRARYADALVLAAESFLTHGTVHREGSDRCDLTVIADIHTLFATQSTDSPPTGTNDVPPERAQPESDPGDAATGNPIGWPGITDRIGRRAHIHGGPPLHSHVVRRLDCDCVQAHHIIHWINGGLTITENP